MSSATIIITGRLARSPEAKSTNTGKMMSKLTIPVDSGFGDNKKTTWWTVTVWGRRASVANQYLQKGSWVTVTGRPEVRTYDKKDGSQGFSAEVNADSWDFVGPKAGPEEQEVAYPTDADVSRSKRSVYKQAEALQGYSDGDIPF